MLHSYPSCLLIAAVSTLFALCGLVSTADAQSSANLITNGGFENGASGWMYQQWENKPLPGAIDKEQHAEGSASFRFGLPGATGGRWFAQEVKLPGTGQDYTLSFTAKGENLPADAARMRVGVEGKGFLGSASGKVDIIKEGGTFGWRKYQTTMAASELGEAKKITLFFYHDQLGQGSLWIDDIAVTPVSAAAAPASATGAAAPEDNTGNLAANGGFEAGMEGWQWQQWDNKPLPGAIDKADRIRGSASFKMGLAGATGARWMAKEIKFGKPGQNYVLSFWLKPTGLAPDSAYVRLGIDGSGWLGASEGKSDLVRLGGSGEWKQYSVPVSAGRVGESTKATLFFYSDNIGQGTLGIDAVALKVASDKDLAAAGMAGVGPTLVGDTSHPTLSTFAVGEDVELTFRAAGLEEEDVKLQLEIVNEHDQVVRKQDVALKVEKGAAEAIVRAPNERLGFYRVKAKLSDGTQLKKRGSRPAGFITYAIVPDPKLRKDYGEAGSRFGMQGGFGPWRDESLAYMGSRWILDGSLEWKKNEPDRAGQFAEAIAAGKFEKPERQSTWRSFTLPTLMGVPQWAVVPGTAPYMTGVLTPEGEKAWADYCRLAVQEYVRRNPDREQNIYQITWEPVYPWGFKGTNEDLIRIYEIAYPVIHAADPKAIVAGPCNGVRGHEIDVQITQMQLGLGKYMDMYSAHPYYPIEPEKAGLPAEVRRMRKGLEDFSGKKNMPMIGTEQGFTTEELVEKEMTQARGLLRQNLIMIGEGWQFNFAYYIVDYLLGEQKGYGYYYNLVDGVPWAPAKASPRPIAPAYAAQTFLLDGHNSLGAIEWLGSTAWGYAFERDGKITLALWDYGDQKREVSLPTGTRKVMVYDWMGNATETDCPMGSTSVVLGPEPIYVTGVSPHVWGPADRRMLSVDDAQPRVYPGTTIRVTGKVRTTDAPFKGDVVLSGEGLTRQTKAISVAAGETASYSFDVSMPASANPATTPMTVALVSDNIQTAAAGARLQIVPSAAILAVNPAFTAGKPAVAVTIKDEQGGGFSGTLETELADIAGTKRQTKLTLSPSETRRIVVDYAGLEVPASKVCQLKATLTADSGPKLTKSGPINFLAARQFAAAPVVDGDLAEWSAPPATNLAGKAMVMRSPEYFSESFKGSLRYAWDEANLYVSADVTDATHYQKDTGVLTWRGDCLQLAFNLDPFNREGLTANVLDTNVRRATELNVALTDSGAEVFRSVTYDAVTLPQGVISSGKVKAAVVRNGQSTRYEVAIPWSELGREAAPKAGELVGLAAAINDANSKEQKSPTGLGLFEGIHPQKEPEKFGLLVLAGKE